MGWNCKYYRARDADDCYGLYKARCSCCGNCLSYIGEKCRDWEKVRAEQEKEFKKWDRQMKANCGVWIE